MLTQIRAGLPSAWIFCEAILKDGTNDATIATWNTYIQGVVSAIGDAKIVYCNGAWTDYTEEVLHPTPPTGTQQVATGILADLNNQLPTTGVGSVTLGTIAVSGVGSVTTTASGSVTLAGLGITGS